MLKKLTSIVLLLLTVITLTACVNQGTAPVYTLTYILDGGTLDTTNPGAYNSATPTFTLINPNKEGYRFLGWSSSEDLSSPLVSCTVELGASGNKTFYAVWQKLAKLTIGVSSTVFTLSQNVYYGEVGDVLMLELILDKELLGSSIVWEYYDEALGEQGTEGEHELLLLTSNIFIPFIFTQDTHNIFVAIYELVAPSTEGAL